MYAGRDGIRDEPDLLELHADLETTNAPAHGPVDTMLGKVPLPEYLRAGLDACDQRRIDIEQSFG